MHQGRINGLLVQGFNPLAALPNKKKLGMALAKLKYMVIIDPLKTETAEFWKNFGEYNDAKPEEIQTEVFRLPVVVLRRGGRLVHQLRPHGAVEVARRRAAGRRQDRQRDHRGAVPQDPRDVRQGRRQGSRPDAEADLGLRQPRQARAGGSAARDQRPRARRRARAARSEGPEGAAARAGTSRRADARFRRCCRPTARTACGNWIYSGVWTQAGNNAARRDISDPCGPGQLPELGLLLARQPARALQPRRRVAGRQALGCAPRGYPLERHRLGRKRRAGHQPGARPRQRGGPVHHDARRRGAAVLARTAGRRTVPRALRAVRDAARREPDAPGQEERDQQPGGARVQGRHGVVRQGRQVPVRRDHLPPHRAPPLLDQERRSPTRSSSRRSSSRSARSSPRRRASATARWSRSRATAARSRLRRW